jgi:hypothetical protein
MTGGPQTIEDVPWRRWEFETHRTLDAIHVASAQLFAARVSTPGLLFVSADKRQTETAVAVGLAARQIV